MHLRNKLVERETAGFGIMTHPEAWAMHAAGAIFRSARGLRAAQQLGRIAERPLESTDGNGERWVGWLPGMLGGWTRVRDLKAIPAESFREWFERRERDKGVSGDGASGDGKRS